MKEEVKIRRVSVEFSKEVESSLSEFRLRYPHAGSESKLGQIALRYYLTDVLERGLNPSTFFPNERQPDAQPTETTADEHSERHEHQNEILTNLRQNLQTKDRKLHLAAIRHLDKIAKANGGQPDDAMMVAVALWVKRAEVGGVDEKLVPNILSDAGRKKRLAIPATASPAAIAAEATPKYKRRGAKT